MESEPITNPNFEVSEEIEESPKTDNLEADSGSDDSDWNPPDAWDHIPQR